MRCAKLGSTRTEPFERPDARRWSEHAVWRRTEHCGGKEVARHRSKPVSARRAPSSSIRNQVCGQTMAALRSRQNRCTHSDPLGQATPVACVHQFPFVRSREWRQSVVGRNLGGWHGSANGQTDRVRCAQERTEVHTRGAPTYAQASSGPSRPSIRPLGSGVGLVVEGAP